MRAVTPAIAAALGAAALFGASTPVAKALVADVHPVVLAGLLYLGSGAGLLALRAHVWLWSGGTGPFGPIEMGGMFTVVKVREALPANNCKDPGWYRHPPRTGAYEWTGAPQPVARSAAPVADASTMKVRPGGGNRRH